MQFRSDKPRRSVNLRDIHGLNATQTVSSSAGGVSSGAGGGGRQLLAHYELATTQIISLAPNTFTNALLNLTNAIEPSTMVVQTTPFLLRADEAYTFWIELFCAFQHPASVERAMLVARNGTATSKGDGLWTPRYITRGGRKEMYGQAIIEMQSNDELEPLLRIYNTSNTAQNLTVLEAELLVYEV